MLGYRGDSHRGSGGGREHIMAANFQRDTERLAQDPIVITQDKLHRLGPSTPLVSQPVLTRKPQADTCSGPGSGTAFPPAAIPDDVAGNSRQTETGDGRNVAEARPAVLDGEQHQSGTSADLNRHAA